MKRTVGTKVIVAGAILMGGALGIIGEMKLAAVGQVFPRVPRTDQEQTASLQTGGTALAATQHLSRIARGRSSQTDPCVPTEPVIFRATGRMIC